MENRNWQEIWQHAESDPYVRGAITLLLLNGVTAEQILHLPEAVVDITNGWITTYDGQTYPLVSYSINELQALLEATPELDTDKLHEAVEAVRPLEAEAHRRLSGAIWLTNEENQIMLELSSSAETPILPLRFTFPFSVAGRLQPGEVSPIAERGRHVLQTAADWLFEQTLTEKPSLLQRITGMLRQGSFVFLIASTGVSGLNLVHNVLMGRLLSPADYSQLTLIITLQLLIGLMPTALQTVIARFTARYHAQDATDLLDALRRRGTRFSIWAGGAAGLVMLLAAPGIVALFRLDSVWLLLPVIAAVPFFVITGADRGLLQGVGGYWWLSGAYVTEGVIRLGVGVVLGYALLAVERSLEGAVWGIAQSMVATWFIAWLALRHLPHEARDTDTTEQRREWVQVGWMTGLMLIGQVLITNSDFLLVKNFFSPDDAGLYAAVSVLGRIVYFGALPLTVLLVPLVARRQALNQPTRPILLLLVGGGVGVCGLLILIAAAFAPSILGVLYGQAYVTAASLLAPYALAASLYTLTNLVITYQIALGSGGETWMPIAAGTAQILAVIVFHDSLAQVITVQIILMSLLFCVVLWRVMREPQLNSTDAPIAGG